MIRNEDEITKYITFDFNVLIVMAKKVSFFLTTTVNTLESGA